MGFSLISNLSNSLHPLKLHQEPEPIPPNTEQNTISTFPSYRSTPAADTLVIFSDKEGNYMGVLQWP